MMHKRYYIKIVPHEDETVHGFHLRRRHIVAVIVALALVVVVPGFELIHTRLEVSTMQGQASHQQAALKQIDSQAEALRKQLQSVQKQNQEIRQLIGAPPLKAPAHSGTQTSWVAPRSLRAARARIAALRAQSVAMAQESDSMKRLALHVLNLRHLRDLARAQVIAAIPSIDPVAGAQVVGCFCYRTSPDVEFHPGVDLGADYGDAVRAAAAGTVVANGWDGGYGIKIDIDHGNGYHTWYAHLSKVDVGVSAHVYKGEVIGEVGSTGFATGPHLHYQIMKNGVAVDPTPYLDGVPSNVIAKLP